MFSLNFIFITFCFSTLFNYIDAKHKDYPNPFRPMPKVVVDLNLAPQDRFQGAVDAVLGIRGYTNSFKSLFQHYNQTLLALLPSNTLEICDAALQTHFPENYKELQGIAKGFQKYNVSITGIYYYDYYEAK